MYLYLRAIDFWRTAANYQGPQEVISVLRTGRLSVVIRRLVHHSWRETRPGRDQLERFSWTGASYSLETGTRPTEFSYVYKYQFVTQVE
jgi:hypothetical protein